jgi:hypothetical protein
MIFCVRAEVLIGISAMCHPLWQQQRDQDIGTTYILKIYRLKIEER